MTPAKGLIAFQMTWRALLVICLLLFLPKAAAAQDSGEKSRQLQLLDVWQARVDLRESATRFSNTQSLFEREMIAGEEYIKDRTAYEGALIRYRRSAIAALDMLSELTIESAVKVQAENGARFVRLRIRNRTPKQKNQELLQLLAREDGALVDSLRLDELRRVYISLKDLGSMGGGSEQGAFVNPNNEVIIAKPYEAVINSLPAGEVRRLRFRLLKDVEDVIVSFRTVGRSESRTIKLEYGSGSLVTAHSAQFSQEADLGQTASFDLLVERGVAGSMAFRLAVEGLPDPIRYEFLDPATSARLSEVNFLAGVTSKQLILRLYLPDTPGELELDRAIRFGGHIIPSSAFLLKGDDEAGEAVVELQIIPRGRGELRLALDSLYFETRASKTIQTTLKVKNVGSRRLHNVRFSADVPGRWRTAIEPGLLSKLDVDEERLVQLKIDTGLSAKRGEFSVRLQSRARSGNTPLDIDDQVLRVKIVEDSNFVWVIAIVVLLVVLMAATVAVAVRISRR